MASPKQTVTRTEADEFTRLPGLFRDWEIPEVVGAGAEYHLEIAGRTQEGTRLFAIYCRDRPAARAER